MCGPKLKNPVYPAPLQLYGVDLPWVAHATHLGHELHQNCTMNIDIKMKRASFIKNSTDIRDMFSFELPSQVLTAVKVYSAHLYGAPLWDLYGDLAGHLCEAGLGPAQVHTQLLCGELAEWKSYLC